MQDNATMQEATGFTFRTILDFFGVGDITGIEILFAALALVGGVLFIVYFFLVMIGGFAEGAIEGSSMSMWTCWERMPPSKPLPSKVS